MSLYYCLFGLLITGLAAQSGDLPVYNSVVEVAQNTPELSTLVQALADTGLNQTLATFFLDVTLFAPTNAAFEDFLSFLEISYEELSSDLLFYLTSILLNHVIPGHYYSWEMFDGQMLTTLNEDAANETQSLIITINNDNISVESFNSAANVITPDIKGGEGVVHMIDYVLLP